ncbi:WXG100 family type VII secretion target [Amycolatopsis silviterrae]|uniref:WXG100 family type VII secretion target n=1 Tax=Amycolatopsis silviterrae TaxID=1656914 RepID=A0ABW5H882_9PSEU
MPDGYTGADVYARMHRYGGNTASLDAGQQAADALKSAHEQLVTRMARLQGKMDASWEGDAAGKAQAGLTPLLQTSQQASEDLGRSAQSLTAQNGGFHGTLNKLTPMDAGRPDTNDLASYSPFGASDSEKAAARWDDADKNNKEAYGSYVAATDGNRNSSAKDYPVLNAAPAGVAVGSAPGDGGTSGSPGGTGGTGGTGGSGGHSAGFHNGGYSPSTGGPGPISSSAPPPGSGVSHPPGSGNPPAQHATAPDSTTAAGYAPKAPVSDAPGFGSGRLPTFGPNSSGTDSVVGGGFGLPAGGYGTPGNSGESGFGGRTGSGGSSGARIGTGGSGQQLGAGAGTGTGTPAGGQSAARPGGAAGGPGSKGSPGMGGMGAGAGKGKGDEDEEHQRKVTYLDEDVDELFGGYPDGMRPTPPTIGA